MRVDPPNHVSTGISRRSELNLNSPWIWITVMTFGLSGFSLVSAELDLSATGFIRSYLLCSISVSYLTGVTSLALPPQVYNHVLWSLLPR